MSSVAPSCHNFSVAGFASGLPLGLTFFTQVKLGLMLHFEAVPTLLKLDL